MVKKLAALAGAGAVLLGLAMPVLARRGRMSQPKDLDIAKVKNSAVAIANTGDNRQENEAEVEGGAGDAYVADQLLLTGDAAALASAVVVANSDMGCGCDDDGMESCRCRGDEIDIARVRNKALAIADTGDNKQENEAEVEGDDKDGGCGPGGHGHHCGGGDDNDANVERQALITGNALSAAEAWSIVNASLSIAP